MARSKKAKGLAEGGRLLMSAEPDLHHIRGLGLALAAMGEAQDGIEPEAVAAVSRSLNEAVERIFVEVREGFERYRRE